MFSGKECLGGDRVRNKLGDEHRRKRQALAGRVLVSARGPSSDTTIADLGQTWLLAPVQLLSGLEKEFPSLF